MSEPQDAVQNATSPNSGEVEWNTIFYTLLPLAMSVMTQPVGSVLRTKPISRTYLRSSPVVCAFDAMHFTVEIIVNRICYSATFREATTEALESRFKDVIDGTESLDTFQTQTVVRWVLFVLGTHGCIIKLAGATGIPWTKTWGFAYVLSFLIFEFAILLRRTGSRRIISMTPNYNRPSSTGGSDFQPVTLNVVLLALSLEGLVTSVCNQWLSYQESPPSANVASIDLDIDATPFFMILVCILLLAYKCATAFLCRIVVSRPDLGEKFLVLETSQAEEIRRNHFYYTDGITWWTAGPMGDKVTLWPLFLFLYNFFVGLLWYRLVYDPKGTSRAVWADVLG